MRFLVLGCNGMAGHLTGLYLKENGHDVTGFAREKSRLMDTVTGDARNEADVKRAVLGGNYDSVINCIGSLNRFAEADKANAVYLNAYLPHFLAAVTEGTEIQVIHLSTDCVFSGKRGGYAEHDLRDGETFYDRSKALGELEDEKNVTLRTSIVGPDINKNGIGLLNWFMQQHGTVKGFTKAIWTGQTTLQLAKTMEQAAKERAHGLYNMVPDASISKYELLRLFDHYMRNDSVTVVPSADLAADKSLVRTDRTFACPVPGYGAMVAELADWMRGHRELYPHYEL